MRGGEALRVFSAIGFCMVIAASLTRLLPQDRDVFSQPAAVNQPSPLASAQPAKPTLIEQPLPESGIIRRYGETEAIAPFKVIASDGSAAEKANSPLNQALQRHYLVKLLDWESGQPLVTIFVRAEETSEIKVPIGKYRLKYASGQHWYGEQALFGTNMAAEQAIEPLIFAIENNQIAGHTVQFKAKMGGNMRAKNIDHQDF